MATEERMKKKSQFPEIVRRYKKNKLAMVGFFIMCGFIFLIIFAGLFGSYEDSITQDIMIKLQKPSAEHWFGTDNYGRDLFLRCVYGTRTSLLVGLASTSFSLILGTLVGLTAGYFGKAYDTIIMRCMDVISSIPSILFAIVIVAALGTSTFHLIVALCISKIPMFARIVRSSTLKASGQEYIEAAVAGGTGDFRVLTKHILPNVLGPLIVQTTTNVAAMILQIAVLSFLGLGIPAPTPEWGAILSGAKGYLRNAAYMTYFPGLCIVLASLSTNMIGDGLRDALDPKLKS